jgi:transposase
MRAPPCSPDLNPIEMLWAEMKQFVAKRFCKTKEEVVTAIQEFKKTVTEAKLKNYIRKLKKVEY